MPRSQYSLLGGQTNLQVVANTLAPYAANVIGKELGHGEDKNKAAQLAAHVILGAALAYVNGGNPTAGGSAAVASEAAADYLTNQYKDKKEYQDVNGEFQANLLPENVKTEIRDLTAAIGAVVGGTVGDSAFNAQIAGVVGQNAVENNDFSVPYGNTNWAQGVDSLISDAKKKGLSDKEIQELLQSYKQPDAKQGREYIEGLTKGSVELAVTSIVPELAIQKLTPIVVTASKSSWFTGVLDTFKGWFGKGDEVVPELSNINTTPIAKEGLLDNLASQMQKPIVNDKKLQNIANDLYRENAKIGNGSTGAAVRYENETGEAVGSKLHTQKANDYSEGLKEWIIKNPNASTNDKMAAEQMLRDLQNALNGK